MRHTAAVLSAMFFMQFASLGVIVPLLTVYLTEHLHFDGEHAGIVFSMSSLALLIAPWCLASITDSIISARRLYQLAHGGACVMMLVLVHCKSFSAFVIAYVLYSVSFAPSGALANTLTFQALNEKAQHTFGVIRMWGTVGWIAIAWVFSALWLRSYGAINDAPVHHMFYVSAACSASLVFLAQLLPVHPQASAKKAPSLLLREAMDVLVSPGVCFVLLLAIVSAFDDRYFYFGAGPFLKSQGVSEYWIMPAMSSAQVFEIAALFFLGSLLKRYSYRNIMIAGLIANVLRFLILSSDAGIVLTLIAFSCHGIAFALFFTSVFIYLDICSPKTSRAGVQLLCGSLAFGLASVLGSLIAGKVMDSVGDSLSQYWIVPMGLSLLSLLLALRFLQNPIAREVPEECTLGEATVS